ncbi:hypothetical protein G2583_2638 [Escherichia coli O55:H7 str. CB9615]|uniref:Uncharacterized protein n=1 Tax=Escherichia coli O157:H7 TaxID=83334 RepID=Q8X3U6_ECO57|nr:hypothetical protein Z3270 [Escherichia coli O157:H7 str. EDL933]ACT72690.1 predicted protein [Escherichia coli O157:H7 str. TW14359]ADD57186.1 hypothetical protein G2583_2638 [Escherichia coli O55:H7 str. CB9615]
MLLKLIIKIFKFYSTQLLFVVLCVERTSSIGRVVYILRG